MKAGEPPGVDSISSELLKYGVNSNSPDSAMYEYLGDEGMAEGVDTIGDHIFTKERKPRAVSGVSYHQPNQPSQQNYVPS